MYRGMKDELEKAAMDEKTVITGNFFLAYFIQPCLFKKTGFHSVCTMPRIVVVKTCFFFNNSLY